MKYTTKPKVVEAIQWEDNLEEMKAFAGGKFQEIPEVEREYSDSPDATAEVLDSLHSVWTPVLPGQWIVKERRGSYYLYDDETFRSTYEPA